MAAYALRRRGRHRIGPMIHGPKDDGAYVAEFRIEGVVPSLDDVSRLVAIATHSIALKSRAGPSRDQRGPCNRACSSEVAIYNALFRLPQS